MGYKQYCNLLENAANCSLRYIYFFAFSLVDESGNGSIEYCELFHLLLRFYVDSTYLHEEVYRIAQQIKTINSRKEQAIKEGKELPKDTEPMLD